MRILLVEDNENKRAQLESFIQESWPASQVVVAISLQGGLRIAKGTPFDVIILDMTLPNFDVGTDDSGSLIHPLGGKEFLRKMKRGKIETPVVVVTQFETFGRGLERLDVESLRSSLADEYRGLCVGTVYYDSAIDTWKEEIAGLITKAVSPKQ
jgi:CheY-like chemotaxis protein